MINKVFIVLKFLSFIFLLTKIVPNIFTGRLSDLYKPILKKYDI